MFNHVHPYSGKVDQNKMQIHPYSSIDCTVLGRSVRDLQEMTQTGYYILEYTPLRPLT